MRDEEYVRGVWADVKVLKCENDKPFWVHSLSCYLGSGPFTDEASMWSAAAEFTRERLEQIRQVEEEIAWLTDGMSVSGDDEPIGDRVLAREQAALTELRRGMK